MDTRKITLCVLLLTVQFMTSWGRYFFPVFTVSVGYGTVSSSCSHLKNVGGFGFYKNGTISMEIECSAATKTAPSPPSLILLACMPIEDEETSKTLPECGRKSEQLCEDFQYSADSFPKSNEACGGFKLKCTNWGCTKWTTEAVIPKQKEEYYEFFMLQCPQKETQNASVTYQQSHCQGNLTLFNNNGKNHLGRGEEPLQYIYKILVILWTGLLGMWICNWVRYRRYSNPLHKILIISPLCKYVVMCLSIARWEIVNSTGIENDTLLIVKLAFQSAEDAMLFMTLMLAAEGWCVMRPHIRKVKQALLPVLFLAFLASVICVIWTHTYFMAFAVCSIVFVIYRALKWCSFNLDVLNKQLITVHNMISQKQFKFRGISLEEQLLAKRDIYTKLRLVIAMYTMVFAIITTMSTFLKEYAYVKILSFEIPELLVYLSLGHIFKLMDFGAYENIEVEIPKEDSVIIFLPYPDSNWPRRQRLILGYPIDNPVVEIVDEKKSLIIDR